MGTSGHRRPGKEIENAIVEDPQCQTPSKPLTIELQGDEFWPLSGKPYFHVVLSKSNLKPLYHLLVPAKMHPVIPPLKIPTFLTYKGKDWEVLYRGDVCYRKMFDSRWKNFAMDNKLQIGDACIFELVDCCNKVPKFRVQILRGNIPSKYQDNTDGESVDAPIIIE